MRLAAVFFVLVLFCGCIGGGGEPATTTTTSSTTTTSTTTSSTSTSTTTLGMGFCRSDSDCRACNYECLSRLQYRKYGPCAYPKSQCECVNNECVESFTDGIPPRRFCLNASECGAGGLCLQSQCLYRGNVTGGDAERFVDLSERMENLGECEESINALIDAVAVFEELLEEAERMEAGYRSEYRVKTRHYRMRITESNLKLKDLHHECVEKTMM